EKMRGPVGSKIKLIVSRGENKKYITFKIKRAVIKVKSVKSHFLESGYGYMRVSQFQKTTADEANKQLKAFAKTGKTKGLIIDLRNNPGGLLLAAVDLADLLLSPGLVVYTQGKAADSRENYNSTQYQLLASTNIVVLMNEGSASASEILAGALQDRKRAIIAGTQSFGKGSVQTILALPKNRAMKLTTSRYYTPNGRSIQAEGITPDIVIPEAKITTIEHSTQMSEADLAGHLDHEGKSPKTLQSVNQHLEGDYQLQHALNLLKAMQLQQ
ncbi:MAG: S41 family peptidase, partial [Sinobacterium sp.]|nr:S41 family peptidase [Sinobacterium sp.]